jgi:hypothetical protein
VTEQVARRIAGTWVRRVGAAALLALAAALLAASAALAAGAPLVIDSTISLRTQYGFDPGYECNPTTAWPTATTTA